MSDAERGFNSYFNFSRLEEAATFFLYESFRYAHRVAEYEVAGILFGEAIESIDPPTGWEVPPMPESFADWMNSDELEVLDEGTLSKLSKAWEIAQVKAPLSGRKLKKKHRTQDIDLIGHVMNLSACLEAVINRHLFYLRESGELEEHLYASLDRTELMSKLLFAFKEQILSKKLHTSNVRHLLRLRNQAVHFKASSAISVSFEELLRIWKESKQILALVRGEPSKKQMEALIKDFTERWISR